MASFGVCLDSSSDTLMVAVCGLEELRENKDRFRNLEVRGLTKTRVDQENPQDVGERTKTREASSGNPGV